MMSRALAPMAFGLLLLVAWQAIVVVGQIPGISAAVADRDSRHRRPLARRCNSR